MCVCVYIVITYYEKCCEGKCYKSQSREVSLKLNSCLYKVFQIKERRDRINICVDNVEGKNNLYLLSG